MRKAYSVAICKPCPLNLKHIINTRTHRMNLTWNFTAKLETQLPPSEKKLCSHWVSHPLLDLCQRGRKCLQRLVVTMQKAFYVWCLTNGRAPRRMSSNHFCEFDWVAINCLCGPRSTVLHVAPSHLQVHIPRFWRARHLQTVGLKNYAYAPWDQAQCPFLWLLAWGQMVCETFYEFVSDNCFCLPACLRPNRAAYSAREPSKQTSAP